MPEAERPSDTPAASEAKNAPQEIPDKLYFRIGEVSKLLGVEPYVLRYWETEFPSLSPKKSDTGHRLYRRKDVEQLLHIKELLYAKRFTIEGARQSLALLQKTSKEVKPEPLKAQASLFDESLLPEIRKELAKILKLLS
jgi:DNA-binding transcriptional MerR regulator